MSFWESQYVVVESSVIVSLISTQQSRQHPVEKAHTNWTCKDRMTGDLIIIKNQLHPCIMKKNLMPINLTHYINSDGVNERLSKVNNVNRELSCL